MNGRLLGTILLASALIAGGAMYWLQVYAFYEELEPHQIDIPFARKDGLPEILWIDEAAAPRAIDSESSPIRYRACFTYTADHERLLADGIPAPDAVPLNAPGWFDCFDAARIGADLESGAATAFLGQENIQYGIDRVLAIYPDGRGFAWNVINRCGEEVFDGNPPPPGCPPPPVAGADDSQ